MLVFQVIKFFCDRKLLSEIPLSHRFLRHKIDDFNSRFNEIRYLKGLAFFWLMVVFALNLFGDAFTNWSLTSFSKRRGDRSLRHVH